MRHCDSAYDRMCAEKRAADPGRATYGLIQDHNGPCSLVLECDSLEDAIAAAREMDTDAAPCELEDELAVELADPNARDAVSRLIDAAKEQGWRVVASAPAGEYWTVLVAPIADPDSSRPEGGERSSVTIRYLGCGEQAAPAPTIVELEHDYPVSIHCSWGDRSEPSGRVTIYTDPDLDGIAVSVDDERGCRAYRREGIGELYAAPLPAWAVGIEDDRERVIAALLADTASRPEVAAARAAYAAIIADLDRQHAAHSAQWDRDVGSIARAFRRRWVQVGEQTVPGKCVVRSSRGTTLGYADVRDGRWLGTIERARG